LAEKNASFPHHVPLKKLFITASPLPCAHRQLDSSPLFRSANQIRHIPLAAYCPPYISLLKTPNQYIFTLKMATAMFVETLDNFQHSSRLIPESRRCTALSILQVSRQLN
jgi:hypothetical protein